MASLATLDSGVGTISSAPSIESIDSLIAAAPSKKCKKVNVTRSDHTKKPKQAVNRQIPTKNTKQPSKFNFFIALIVMFLLDTFVKIVSWIGLRK